MNTINGIFETAMQIFSLIAGLVLIGCIWDLIVLIAK
jgi:hypothetical protein